MDQAVTLPLWLVLVLIAAAGWLLLERVLVPSVRWFFRRKVNQAIDEMNRRLHLELPPFKLNRRQVLIDRLRFDPEVLEAAHETAQQEGVPVALVMQRVQRYAAEICPSFNAYMYFRIGNWLARRLVRLFYWVRVVYADKPALLALEPRSSLVFVINHRSNMDYLLASYMAVRHAALSYAVGEWARVWPLQQLIRSMGAYFVRRGSGNALYRCVLARYVQMAVDGGIVQAVFPEGGLSRDGRLRGPKLGLLDYMVRGFDPRHGRDIVFIPVGINYDRVLEDRSLLREAGDEAAVPASRALATAFGFAWKNLVLAMHHRWRRFGYAAVQFGRPVSLRAWCAERTVDFRQSERSTRFVLVEQLAASLMVDIGRVVPVLAVPLIALELGAAPTARFTALELKAALQRRLDVLRHGDARYLIYDAASSYAIDNALDLLVLRRLLVLEDDVYRANPNESAVLAYYAASIEHLFGENRA